MTLHASRGPEKEQRPPLLVVGQRIFLPSRKLVYWSVSKDQSELELCNGQSEHIESDESAGSDRREYLAEPLTVFCDAVDPSQYLGANVGAGSRPFDGHAVALGRLDGQ